MTESIEVLKQDYIKAKSELEQVREALKPINTGLDDVLYDIKKQYLERYSAVYAEESEKARTFEEINNKLRDALIENFKVTGIKTYDENLGVTTSSKLEYEEDKAIEWCRKNAPVFIKEVLDRKGFEAMAAGVTSKLDFVTTVETASTRIKGI